MTFYDSLLQSLRELKSDIKDNPVTSTNVSGAIAGELTIITVLLLSALLFSHINKLISVVLFIIFIVIIATNLPLIPKIIKEENNSLDSMLFYVLLTLGILIPVIYWGVNYV